MDQRKRRIQQFVEKLPSVRTIEVNRKNMKCEILTKGFAHWLEDDVPSGKTELVIKIPPAEQEDLLKTSPEKYHAPSVKVWKQWLGIRLDVDALDWEDIESRLVAAYKLTAPKSLWREIKLG